MLFSWQRESCIWCIWTVEFLCLVSIEKPVGLLICCRISCILLRTWDLSRFSELILFLFSVVFRTLSLLVPSSILSWLSFIFMVLITYFMPSSLVSVSEHIMFLAYLSTVFNLSVCLFVHLVIFLPRYLMYALNIFDKTYREYIISPFWCHV